MAARGSFATTCPRQGAAAVARPDGDACAGPRARAAALADASVPGPLDELVRAEIPRLMAALLVLAGRVIAVLESQNASSVEPLELLLRPGPGRPTRWELERAARVLDLTL